MPSSPSTRTKVFISYSHKDKKWLKRLQKHLKPLEREDNLDCWDDTHIQSGDNWKQEIQKALDKAQVAVLLISANFFASDFIDETELPSLLNAAKAKGVCILPVILSACRFERNIDLASFQSVNPLNKPLSKNSYNEQEEIFDRIAQEIENAFRLSEPIHRNLDQTYNDLSSSFIVDLPHNPVPECAELIAGTTQGSSFASFDLLPEVRFGREEFEVDELSISYGVKEAALRIDLEACRILPGPRLGDNHDKYSDIIAKGNNTWEIKGPKEDGILMRRALGSEPLCCVCADGATQPHVNFELTCRGRNVDYKLFGEEAKKLSVTQTRILEIFFNKCLNIEGGVVTLSRATLSARDNTP
jgi:hypothetical protein